MNDLIISGCSILFVVIVLVIRELSLKEIDEDDETDICKHGFYYGYCPVCM